MTTLEWIESVLASIVVLVLAALVRIAFKQEGRTAIIEEKIKQLEDERKLRTHPGGN